MRGSYKGLTIYTVNIRLVFFNSIILFSWCLFKARIEIIEDGWSRLLLYCGRLFSLTGGQLIDVCLDILH